MTAVKIALDPTPFHHSHSLLELPGVVPNSATNTSS